MKLKPVFLLIALLLFSIAFLGFLLNEAEKDKVCCREKQYPEQKTENSDEIPAGSINHLIASNL